MDFKDKMIYIPLVILAVFEIIGVISAGLSVGSLTPGIPPAGNGTQQPPIPPGGVSIGTWQGFITTIVATCFLIGAIGFRFLGSGFGEKAVHIITTGIIYICIWLALSGYAEPELAQVPFLMIGGTSMLYVLLTAFYAFGAFLKTISSGSSGSEVSE